MAVRVAGETEPLKRTMQIYENNMQISSVLVTPNKQTNKQMESLSVISAPITQSGGSQTQLGLKPPDTASSFERDLEVQMGLAATVLLHTFIFQLRKENNFP